jgi:chromosome segregation protein
LYLKSLTLRGFKSFASATSLRLEPGITCVVGPNGSGKSNVVDALSWVMGEQGAKSLRGGKMEDVVFAGTTSRPPLGRAEVTLTIDNSDGALPIEYAEVTISRLMFRSGQSEYAINGDHCRLLDVQDLLSDSGLGREMHVIVGQGQLDEILHSGPEARRALIEEAAGVLKHRKRKEKALRKLEAMQANLTRLVDLTAELRSSTRWPGAGPGKMSWTRPPSRPRPCWPRLRRPGSRCPRWPNGSAAPSTWRRSGTGC